MRNFLLAISVFLLCGPLWAATWYVRSDGGSRYDATYNSTDYCDGLHDAAASGHSTTDHACAYADPRSLWNDPWAYGNSAWVISGGDTVSIEGGTFQIAGSSSGSTQGTFCYGVGIYCAPPDVPSGTSGAHTVIEGMNYAACSVGNQPDPTKTAKLWSGGGAFDAITLGASQYVDLRCIDLSDHAQCNGINLSCTGLDYTTLGIYTGSAAANGNISLTDVHIHGFESRGILGNIGGPWAATRVLIDYNGWGGWDFDPGSGQASNGSVTGSYLTIAWNGCTEEYPVVDPVPAAANGCNDDGSGGYGDGLGTPVTANLNFSCDHCVAFYNTQDGFDFTHTENASVTFTNSLVYGNMGAGYKVGPEASITIRNNLSVGNCRRLSAAMSGAPSGYNSRLSDFCRAAGDQSGVNFVSSAVATAGNFTSSGTALTGTGTSWSTAIAVGDYVLPASFSTIYPISTWKRQVTAVGSNTSVTIASAFPSDVSGVNLLDLGPSGAATSSSIASVEGNSYVGYGATFIDGACISSLPAQAPIDTAACSGYTFTWEDNLVAGYSEASYNGGQVPGMWGNNPVPTTQDYNLYYNTRTSPCVGLHDVCAISPALANQPATPLSAESALDDFDFYPTTGSPLLAAGTAVSGLTTDYYGTARANPPTIGAVETTAPATLTGTLSGATISGGTLY